MTGFRLRTKPRHVPDRARRPRFAGLAISGCVAMAFAALLVAATQNSERTPLVAWRTAPPPVAVAAAVPERILPSFIDAPRIQTAREIFDRFVSQGYTVERVREDATTVPRVIAVALPRPRGPGHPGFAPLRARLLGELGVKVPDATLSGAEAA